ncbi:MAG: hypothetical protein GC193_11515 [Cryomorphaceae bacterium]|nr:hypothetical protein [Cryomorphaceae bacterium]
MFEEGNIVYFTPFYFSNGKSDNKPKYCIVIKSLTNETIIASLPTSKDSIPSGLALAGCIEKPDINLNSFVFNTDTIVTTCGKRFHVNTFVYGHQLDIYSIKTFKDIYRHEGTDYTIFGRLKPELYQQLLECLRNSKAVKKKYLRLLK